MVATAEKAPPGTTAVKRIGLGGGLLIALGAVAVLAFLSIALGSRSVTLQTVLDAFFDPTATSPDLTVIRDMRVPRTLLAIVVGTALGLGGTLLQGVARNPLADPGIMGINSGAALAIVGGIMLIGVQSAAGYVWFAFAGAGIATVLVYGLAATGRDGATPVKLALAGAAVTAVFGSVTSAIVLSNVDALNEMRFWQVGALSGRFMPVFWQLAPFLVIASLIALFAGRPLNTLALGDDVARALGQPVALTRTVLFALIAVLCGAATAAAGPIAFLGLMVPHLARFICGPDYRWILPYSALLGPVLLLACDIAGRVVVAPGELQVGVVIGVVGAPVFIALARFRRLVQL
ncbi:iron ABC transporter permease [Actinorhabdospora filicis]|uniref:Iron ABC transporter permease n=1 Tax=Actinorhabdospora filicis TaxID=1785913 RepID=A0A9W6SKF0_9ACTN|nr:iron chelate uptake ABC transporter family permease subunit [Actinorhabdospora filicis]GLZ77868.1 iron ABC transporter permease [Actinorhabdospora filicis]